MARMAEFELRVLLTVLRCGDDAYAVAVHGDLETRTGAKVALGAVYITLDRLERKGWLSSRFGEPSAVRGGRAKRFYTATARGRTVLKVECEMIQRLWTGLGLIADR